MIHDISTVTIAVLLVASYLIGSIPSTLIASRLTARVDLRDLGSGNAGGTNAIRVLGPVKGVMAGTADVAKGLLCAALPGMLFGSAGSAVALAVLSGSSAVVGHIWPVWAGFRGGKGVATCIGVLAWLNIPAAILFCGIGLAVMLATKYVSVGSISASISLPVVLLILAAATDDPVQMPVLLFCLAVPFLVLFTHRSNLHRLRHGTELRFNHRVDLSSSTSPKSPIGG